MTLLRYFVAGVITYRYYSASQPINESTYCLDVRVGRVRGNVVIFTETDGHPVLLAAHDRAEDANSGVSRVSGILLSVESQDDLEPHFCAFRQRVRRAEIGAPGADVCRSEGELSPSGCPRRVSTFAGTFSS
jgi:hypothetical protein